MTTTTLALIRAYWPIRYDAQARQELRRLITFAKNTAQVAK